MSPKQLILVTGASGFLGAQIVDHLLQAGYAVRGTSRSVKAEELRKNNTNPDFEVAVIDDLVNGDFSAALEGVDVIIHNASPMPGRDNVIEVAVEGTLNVLRQAYAAKVYKVTLVSSIAATISKSEEYFDGSRLMTDQDWNKVTKEEALRPETHPFMTYSVSKALAERAAWDFVESHSEMDLTAILPPCTFGPLSPRQIATTSAMLSTNEWIYSLLALPVATYSDPASPHTADVRDVAQVIVCSLKSKPATRRTRERIMITGSTVTYKQIVRHLAAVRPNLKARLVDGGEPPAEEDVAYTKFDTSRAEELLGKPFIGWQKSVEDAIDSILQREEAWVGRN